MKRSLWVGIILVVAALAIMSITIPVTRLRGLAVGENAPSHPRSMPPTNSPSTSGDLQASVSDDTRQSASNKTATSVSNKTERTKVSTQKVAWKPLQNDIPEDQFAYNVVKEISNVKYGGRQPGTQGYTDAANYVASVYKQLGLIPAGNSGSFLQPYQTGLAQFTSMPTLVINGHSLKIMTDFKVHGMSESSSLSGNQVVFVGNGFSTDYKGVNVIGKIVAFTEDMNKSGSPTGVIDRAMYAKKQGAAGVLIVTGNLYPMGSFERPLRSQDSGTLAFYISPAVARSMGLNISSSHPQTVHANVQGTIPIHRTDNQTSYNVLGMIPGKDKTKTVMIEVNLDGYGKLPDGRVFPGASADASGVGDLAGLAEYYRSLDTQPDVNILFAAIGSECYDRSGIKAFLQHTTSFGNIIADINLYDVGGTEDQTYLAVDGKSFPRLDAAAKFAVKLDRSANNEVHDTAKAADELGNFDNSVLRQANIPNVFVRTSDSTGDSFADSIGTIKLASLRHSMNIAKQMVFYESAVTDSSTVFHATNVKQVNVPEVGHTMSMVETKHFQVFYEPAYTKAIPALLPELDQIWDEDQWWNYEPAIGRKIKIYLVTNSKDGWATAHRTAESTNANTGGIQSPGNYSVTVVLPPKYASDPAQVRGTVIHEFNHDSATYELMKRIGNTASFNFSNIIHQTRADLDNQECSGHLTPLLFDPQASGVQAVGFNYHSISTMFQAPTDSKVDWSSYNGDNFQSLNPSQWTPHYDQLGSLYTYIWETYGPEKAREICYAMYVDSRNLPNIIQADLGVPFRTVEAGWYAWMKTAMKETFVGGGHSSGGTGSSSNGTSGKSTSGQGTNGSRPRVGTRSVSGTELDANGKTVLTSQYLVDQDGRTYFISHITPPGTFTYSNLPDGTYTITTRDPMYPVASPTTVTVHGSDVTGLTVHYGVPMYSIQFRVLKDGQPFAGKVYLRDPSHLFTWGPYQTSGAGDVTVNNVAPGTWEVYTGADYAHLTELGTCQVTTQNAASTIMVGK